MDLTKKKRDGMPKSDFLGPNESYPANDATHARLAISGASHAEHAGNISAAEEHRIQAGARARLKKFDHATERVPSHAKHAKGPRGR